MGQIRGKIFRNILLVTVANTCFASAAFAQHVWVDPRGETKVTWSDNINLDAKGENKESGFVLNASAGFNTRIEGRKLKGALDYAADYYYFLNDGGTDLRHSMFGVLDAEIIKNHLSVNTRASLRQVFLSQSDSISHNEANRSDNRRLVQNYTGSALLKGGMREFADWRINYRYGLTLSSADNLDDETLTVNFSDSQTHEIQASIGSGYRFNNLEWRLFGRSSTVYRSLNVNDYRNDQVGGEVWYKFNRHFQIVGEVSHSRNNFQRAVLNEDGFGWEAGFRWTPGRKLDLTVRHGEVGNRKTWSARMQYLFTTRFDFAGSYTDTLSADSIVLNDNLQTWQFNEEQGITDTQNLPVDERDPRFTLSDVDFRRQNATGVFTLRKKRTQIYLSGNLEWRTYDDDTGTNSTWGASTGFKHRVDRNTTLNGTFSYRHSRFGDDSRVDNYIVGNLQWNERLSRYFKFTVSLDHTQRLSNSEGLDLMENAVTVHLRGTF
ncbi:TIGR03016 family PEP-CTERM system-associated outer membrane protein [Kordiimonas gwangyangensis]|uniref:TIGR03016 family PEP-CTERM system-associated outer membrane protein n=1 Tax=Kordiimonas gwangyangensis TaxID=288022 RepID=UPI00037C8EB0|nr:TIGR03016 family PEP-CTERM system-associated outer membrane protein [Kordiimonas gwangyangensis]